MANELFSKVENKLRVLHFAQVPCKPFIVEVKDEVEAKKIIDTLAFQHLFLLEQNIIPDYSNSIIVEMYDESIEEGTKKPYGWGNYWNEEEMMEWSELEEEYFN
jgi:Superinfection exclusion gene product 17